jgi:catechol 2,3-dioxygenase-like lactoylglutathione lyase family enzyme
VYLKHIGLVCSSENNSDKFYQGLLGLEKKEAKILPRMLSKKIFDIDAEYKIINYVGSEVHFEIFLGKQDAATVTRIEHICLEVDNISGFLKKCHTMDIHTLQIPKGDDFITFITDFDGNLFEIKERISHS